MATLIKSVSRCLEVKWMMSADRNRHSANINNQEGPIIDQLPAEFWRDHRIDRSHRKISTPFYPSRILRGMHS